MATDNAAQSNYETLDTAQLARSFNQKNLQQQYHRATAFRLKMELRPLRAAFLQRLVDWRAKHGDLVMTLDGVGWRAHQDGNGIERFDLGSYEQVDKPEPRNRPGRHPNSLKP